MQWWAQISLSQIPFLLNQCGSALYMYALSTTPVSVAVPTANSLAMVVSLGVAFLLGEPPLRLREVFGIMCIVLGLCLCLVPA
jgi:drug/metabolite transporter (DMT)-like permease